MRQKVLQTTFWSCSVVVQKTERGILRNSVINSNCEKKSTFRRLTDLFGGQSFAIATELAGPTACRFEFAPPFIGGQKERAQIALVNITAAAHAQSNFTFKGMISKVSLHYE